MSKTKVLIEPFYLRIANFDIGKKNFAYYVEDCEIPTIEKLSKRWKLLPSKIRTASMSKTPEEIKKMQEETMIRSKTVDVAVEDLRFTDKDVLDIETRENIIEYLRSKSALWSTCDVIVIEQQFFNTYGQGRRSKKVPGTGANVDAIKIAELVLTFFMICFPQIRVFSFGAQFKTRMLGAPPDLKKEQRKKWASEKAREIAEKRKDRRFLDYCAECKKRKQKVDDISDCLIMCQAFKYKHLICEI